MSVNWKSVLKIRWFEGKPSFHVRLRFRLRTGHHMGGLSRQTKTRMRKHLQGHFTWDGTHVVQQDRPAGSMNSNRPPDQRKWS